MAWPDHVADTSLVVDCEGARHVVRWSAGGLVLEAHPDVAAERVLVALGGVPPPCLGMADLWEAAVADGGFIWEWAADEIGPARARAWLHTALERLRNEGVQEFLHRLPIGRAERMGRVLATLPPVMVDRAAMTLAWRLEAAPDPSLDEPLAEAVARRLRRAFVASVGGLGGVQTAALVPFRCRVEGGSAPAVSGRLAGRSSSVVVTVGTSWLAHVWARQVTVVDGAMVLAADERDGGLDTTVMEWHPASGGLEPRLRTVTVVHRDGRWTIGQGAGAAGGRATKVASPPPSR